MTDGAPRAAADGARPVLLPAPAFRALREALLAAADGESRLRDAGYFAGRALYDGFGAWLAARGAAGDPARVPLDRFAAALGDYAAEHGWGALTLELAGGAPTVAMRADRWFEADGASRAAYPGCHFSTGLLAGFFGRLAGRPLAVLETACTTCGDAHCRFEIGSPAVLDRVYAERYGDGGPDAVTAPAAPGPSGAAGTP